LSYTASGSVGLFIDQLDNRRRLLTGHVAAGFPWRWEAGQNRPPTPPQERSKRPDPRERIPCSDGSNRAGAGEKVRSLEGSEVGSSLPLAGMELLNTFAYTCG